MKNLKISRLTFGLLMAMSCLPLHAGDSPTENEDGIDIDEVYDEAAKPGYYDKLTEGQLERLYDAIREQEQA